MEGLKATSVETTIIKMFRYVTPLDAGYSTEFVEESLEDHIYPTGRSFLNS